MTTSFSEIPIFDLARAEDPQTQSQSLLELRRILVQVGFLYIANHGVPAPTIERLVNVLPHIFALPPAAKDEVALVNSPHFLGYSKFGSEQTAKRADQREQYEFANELAISCRPNTGDPLFMRLHGPNQWPSAYPQLRAIVESYIKELTDLAQRFLRLVAEAFELPTDTFFQFLSEQHRLKLVHYKSAPEHEVDGKSQGVGPHKDSSGWMTFLLQASPPSVKGLQALNKSGDWIDVPVIPGTFVVNMGQAFEVVTNGVCKATTHRVLMSGSEDRYSVPFFQGVRKTLTKAEMGRLWQHFGKVEENSLESEEGMKIDSAFLRGRYNTWGESQLRTKIRSHQDVGRKHYTEVFDKYVNDDV
jgi:isopenicillin N synthase-like dioxygenase